MHNTYYIYIRQSVIVFVVVFLNNTCQLFYHGVYSIALFSDKIISLICVEYIRCCLSFFSLATFLHVGFIRLLIHRQVIIR